MWYHCEWYYNYVWTIEIWHISFITACQCNVHSNKSSKVDKVSDAYLWHCRLGHVNKNRLDRLTKEKILDISNYESLLTCESYLLEKMTKSPFKEKGERAANVLSLVHSMHVDPWAQIPKVGIITLLFSLTTYLGMDTSILWSMNLNHLNYSNNFIMK